MESYKESFIEENFPDVKFIQDNESKSSFGVLRGLHFQNPPFEQSKLVRVVKGQVLDIALDLRKKSQTYGRHLSFILSDNNQKQLFIPKGFAHGFVVTSKEAILSYKVDKEYHPLFDSGIRFDDKDLSIDWKVSKEEITVSQKDSRLQTMDKFKSPF